MKMQPFCVKHEMWMSLPEMDPCIAHFLLCVIPVVVKETLRNA